MSHQVLPLPDTCEPEDQVGHGMKAVIELRGSIDQKTHAQGITIAISVPETFCVSGIFVDHERTSDQLTDVSVEGYIHLGLLGSEIGLVEKAEKTGLHLPDNAGHAGIEVPKNENDPVRSVLEHASSVLRVLQRLQAIDLLFHRAFEQFDIEGDPAWLTGHVLITSKSAADVGGRLDFFVRPIFFNCKRLPESSKVAEFLLV